MAVLTAVRDGDDPWVPVRRCGCAHGGDPMAVRVGSTVFALRRREAQAVLVALDVP